MGLATVASAPSVSAEAGAPRTLTRPFRSEEHTSELQSRLHLVCRLLLEKKKKAKRGVSRNVGRGLHLVLLAEEVLPLDHYLHSPLQLPCEFGRARALLCTHDGLARPPPI